MTTAELVQALRRKMSDDYMINPNRVSGLYAVEIGNVPLFYAETNHDAELIAQNLLAVIAEQDAHDRAAAELRALAQTFAQGETSDDPSEPAVESD